MFLSHFNVVNVLQPELYKSRVPGCPGDYILYGGVYLWVLSVEFAPYHTSGTQNFKVAPRFEENLCTPTNRIFPKDLLQNHHPIILRLQNGLCLRGFQNNFQNSFLDCFKCADEFHVSGSLKLISTILLPKCTCAEILFFFLCSPIISSYLGPMTAQRTHCCCFRGRKINLQAALDHPVCCPDLG